MDDANRAMCYALRNPGKDGTPMKLRSIQKLVDRRHYFQVQDLSLGVLGWVMCVSNLVMEISKCVESFPEKRKRLSHIDMFMFKQFEEPEHDSGFKIWHIKFSIRDLKGWVSDSRHW